MNRSFRITMLGLVVCTCVGVVGAEAAGRDGEVRGTFVKLVEKKVGDGWYLGIVVQQFEGKGEAVLLIPRKNRDLNALARKLTKGQKVEAAFVIDSKQMFIRRLEAERPRERAREGGGELAELRELVKKMRARLAQMERQIVELREVNARLRRELAGKDGGRDDGKVGDKDDGNAGNKDDGNKDGGDKDGEGGFPAGLRGFRGMLTGTVKSKLDRGFVLKVEKVGRVWRANKAKRPADAVGKALTMVVRADSRMGRRHLAVIRELKVGDRVLAEAFHIEGNRLTLVEELRKVD